MKQKVEILLSPHYLQRTVKQFGLPIIWAEVLMQAAP